MPSKNRHGTPARNVCPPGKPQTSMGRETSSPRWPSRRTCHSSSGKAWTAEHSLNQRRESSISDRFRGRRNHWASIASWPAMMSCHPPLPKNGRGLLPLVASEGVRYVLSGRAVPSGERRLAGKRGEGNVSSGPFDTDTTGTADPKVEQTTRPHLLPPYNLILEND